MKFIVRAFLLLFTAKLLSGCASVPESIKATDKVDPQKGILLASVTIDDAPGVMDGWYFYKQKGSADEQRLDAVGLVWMTRPDDYPTDKSKDGRLIALPVKTGEYELSNWMLYISQLGGFAQISPKTKPTPLTFNIQPGKITYLGNLHINTVSGKNIFGVEIPVGGDPIITNNQNIDFNLLKAKYPNLSSWPVQTNILDGNKWKILK